jgi:hypothetical protein
MIGLVCFVLAILASPFESKLRLQAENADERRKSALGRELLKLGFSVAQSTVAKYMVKRRGPPSQGWRAPDIAAMDLSVVPKCMSPLVAHRVISLRCGIWSAIGA